MPIFKYRAADGDGRSTEILIEADSKQESLNKLRVKGLTPIQLISSGEASESVGASSLWKRKELDPCEFTNRLVPLLKAHIPLERSLAIIAEGTEDEKAKNIVNDLRRGLHEGKKFSAMIKGKPSIFPPMYSNMVEAGEETGSLSQVMAELQRFLNSGKELKEYLITSSIYPLFVLTVTGAVVTLLFTVFLPRFAKIFADTGKTLPLPTQIMLFISSALLNFWWLWLLLFAAFIYLIVSIRKGGKSKEWWDEVQLKIPIMGGLFHMIEITRFIRTLAVLLQHHVHLLDTIRISERVLQNTYISKSLASVAAELRGGAKLSAALAKSPFFPKTAIRMLSIGEETGNMGEMLDQVANNFEEDIRSKIKRLLALFEPAVILFLAIVVLSVVLSIFMALMKMNQI